MRLHGLILAILLSLAALVAPASIRAQEVDAQAQIDLWIVTLDRIEQDLNAGDVDARKITALEQELRALQEAARSLRGAAEKELAPLRREQEALGILPPATETAPAEGVAPRPTLPSPLSEGAEQRRMELEARVTEVEGRIRQIDLVLTRAQALLRQLAELSSRQTAERLLSRGPSIFDASTWATARSEFTRFGYILIEKLEDWWTRSRPARIGWAPWLVATFVAAIALLATIFGRRWLHRRYGYDPSIEQPSYARTVVAATVEALTGGLSPALALLAFGSTMITLNVATPRTAPVPFAAGIGFIFYFIASNVVRAIFSPDLPKWRLAPLSAEKSQRLGRLLHLLAIYLAVVTAIYVTVSWMGNFGPESNGIRVLILTSGTALILFLLLDPALWKPTREEAADAEPAGPPAAPAIAAAKPLTVPATASATPAASGDKSGEPDFQPSIPPFRQFLRLLLAAALIAVPIASIAGYYELARHITRVILLGTVSLWLAYLIRIAIRELLRWLLIPGTYRVGPLGRALSLRREGSERLALLLQFGADAVLGLATAHILLLIVGVPQTIISVAVGEFLDGVTVGEVTFSPGDIIIGLAIFIGGIVITRYVSRLIDTRVLPRTRFDSGVRNSLTVAANYVGILIAGIIGIAAMGLDLSNLAIIAGALSVGIGFGLREVVNNFVSGLLLLVERPIKVGDWIVVGEFEGTVRRISVRSTEIETFDRADVIIPNSLLITGSVMNWTHRSKTMRLTIAVSVTHNADPQKVYDILTKLPERYEEVLRYPAPHVSFTGYDENSLDFLLLFFVRDATSHNDVPTRLRLELLKVFEAEGIEIPHPQRDIRILTRKTGDATADGEAPVAAS
jgi:small-conductance mechanosensitive channel